MLLNLRLHVSKVVCIKMELCLCIFLLLDWCIAGSGDYVCISY